MTMTTTIQITTQPSAPVATRTVKGWLILDSGFIADGTIGYSEFIPEVPGGEMTSPYYNLDETVVQFRVKFILEGDKIVAMELAD